MKKQSKYVISYNVSINAVMTADKSQICGYLSGVKAYRFTEDKGSINVISEEQDRKFIFNLDESHISAELLSNTVLENPKRDILLKLFELLSNCKWKYEIKLSEVYAHVSESLIKNQLNHYSNMIKEMNSNEYSDILLSKRIIELRKKNLELENGCAKLRNKLYQIAPELIIARSGREATIQDIMEYTGLDKNEIQSALSELPNLGYKVIYSKGNKLNIVRT
ncbi:MAG: hypothetical protein M1520_01965 [Candidatus Marsarchaeota archaeon]|jgi:hypothetical protein|nr:hypothetical protein [Candidatus Marsarchaeota archaeon]